MASNNGEQEPSQATPRPVVVPPRSEGKWPLSGYTLHRAIRTNIKLAQESQYNAPSPLGPPLYMNRQPHPHPLLAPANHAAAVPGLMGQQQTPAIQARNMRPPPLPQSRLAPGSQLSNWTLGRSFSVQLDRLYNFFPIVQQNSPQGNLYLSMAPSDFFGNNYWAIEPRWDLDLDQLRALIAAHDRIDQQAPAQQVQSEQAVLVSQAPTEQVQPTIPTWRILYQMSPFSWGLAEVIQVLSAPFDTTQFMPTWEAVHRRLPDRGVPGSLQNNQTCTVCSNATNMVHRCVQCQVNLFEREGKLHGILWMIQVYGMWKEKFVGEVLPSPKKEVLLLELNTRLKWLNERQQFIWKESLRIAREAEKKHQWYCLCQGGSMYETVMNSPQGTMEESEVTLEIHSMEEHQLEERQAEEELCD